MKNQVKVEKTEIYKDSQKGDTIVCRGRLIFISKFKDNESKFDFSQSYLIISETEETIGCESPIMRAFDNAILIDNVNSDNRRGEKFYKILALPENFSDKQIDAIVDGKLKNGDEVLIECEWKDNDFAQGSDYKIKAIKLNKDNHITLLPVAKSDVLLCESCKKFMHAPKEKCDYCSSTSLSQTHVSNGHYVKKESWDEIIKKVNYVRGYCLSQEQIALLKENYNPPTRK